MFENPSFTFWNLVYTAVGSAVLWGTWGRTRLKAFVLSDLLGLFLKGRWLFMFEFLVFIALGCLVGIGVVHPVDATQAITAGFAWTGAFARPEYFRR